MLKTLTFGLSLAVILGVSSLSMAAGHHTYASEQGAPVATAQSYPSAQSVGCGDTCGPVKKKCSLFERFKPKPHEYTYEWVLKKKKVHKPLFGHKNKGCGGCAEPTCATCGVYPTSQAAPSGQSYGGESYGSGQAYGAGQTYGAGQSGAEAPAPVSAPTEVPEPPAAPATPEVPAAPAAPAAPTANAGGLLFLSPAGN